MRPSAAHLALLALFAGLAAANVWLRVDPQRRNVELLPEMVAAVPHESFTSSELFADGKTMREPAPGTIVRGRMPFHYGASAEEALRAGRELVNPVSPEDEESLARGAAVWATFCAVCHGPAGLGDGTVSQRGFPAPPSLLAPRALRMPDGQMFHILTMGQANMPSYAAQIAPEDRWRVIRYVRTLQAKAQPAVPAAERSQP